MGILQRLVGLVMDLLEFEFGLGICLHYFVQQLAEKRNSLSPTFQVNDSIY